jgi:enoyl-CoA hydratase/carnithine racemase
MMILAGERLSAAEALQHGLAQKVVPRGLLMDEARRLATAIALVPPAAIAAAKSLINSASSPELVRSSIEIVTELHGSPESRQAVNHFMDLSK